MPSNKRGLRQRAPPTNTPPHPGVSFRRISLTQVWNARDSINWASCTVGIMSIVIYFGLRRCNAHLKSKGITGFFLPEALIVVIISTFFSWAGGRYNNMSVAMLSSVGGGGGSSVVLCCVALCCVLLSETSTIAPF